MCDAKRLHQLSQTCLAPRIPVKGCGIHAEQDGRLIVVHHPQSLFARGQLQKGQVPRGFRGYEYT